ncbi:MAG TPA: DnaA/Hda family protein, partial [Candidatus Caenarcaniphilales bacterium]
MEISVESLWSQVLERLQLQLSRPTFETWIKTASAEKLEHDRLVILTPNPFARNWLQKYYVKTIVDVVQDVLGRPIEIQIVIAQGEETASIPESMAISPLLARSSKPETLSTNRPKFTDLNSKYSFSRFVVGPNNRMAHAACLAVAESPGREFNPLFLCGGVGLGKTHLMQAIGHYRLEIRPDSKIFYV